MIARIDKLAELGTSVVAFSGGEPMLHPDLDTLIAAHSPPRHDCRAHHQRLPACRRSGSRRSTTAGLDYLQISIDNVEPDEVSKKSLRLLDKKLQWLAEYAHFDININSVVGGGIKNPDDARTINQRAAELGFSTSIGIIHDGSGLLKPLGPAERAVFDDVMQRIDGRRQVLKNLYSGIRSFQMNLADGKPNDWQCRAGARYLYVCENGLVHWCSQQRGCPGVPLDDLHAGGHPARVPGAEVVRAALHDRLRAPGVDDGLLAKAADGRSLPSPRDPFHAASTESRMAQVPSRSTSHRTSISRKSTTRSTRRARKWRSATTSRARARRSISIGPRTR